MDDILDFNQDNYFVNYLFVQSYQVEGIVALLTEHNIAHRIKELKHLDDTGFVPLAAETHLNRSDFAIQITKNFHSKVDELMDEHPELLHDSSEVRKIFLRNALDKEGLIDVLLFPEDWSDRDPELAAEILASHGIVIPASEYPQRRAEREKVLKKQEETSSSNLLKKMFVFLIIITMLFLFAAQLFSDFSYY